MKEIDYPSIVQSIENGNDLAIEGLSLKEFRDIYFEVKRLTSSLRWIAIFLGDEVVFQPLGRSSVLLTLVNNGRHWKKENFDFMDDRDVLMLGAVNGKYCLQALIREFFSMGKIVIAIMLWLTLLAVGLFLLPVAVISKINDTLINVMSIFISIFVVFSTVIVPEEHFRFVEDERFTKLTATDKTICILGLTTIITSIVGMGYGMVLEKSQISLDLTLEKLSLSVMFSTAILGALISFWMVITYHFDRKTRLSEITMAKLLLRQIQSKYSSCKDQ